MPVQDRTRVFIGYSHVDAEWLGRLQVHLRPLTREQLIEVWADTRITPGSEWREEIKHVLATAYVAVILVSADFLASDFIANDELPPLLDAARHDGTKIVPVVVSPSRFLRTGLSRFQTVNDPAQPLVNLSRGEQELVFDKVAQTIEAAFAEKRIKSLEQTVEGQQETINKLVVFSMAFYLFEMLKDLGECEKGRKKEYIFHKTEIFGHHLRWLRDHGYIEMIKVGELHEGEDIGKKVKLTPVGRYYVDLRLRYERLGRKPVE